MESYCECVLGFRCTGIAWPANAPAGFGLGSYEGVRCVQPIMLVTLPLKISDDLERGVE